MTIAVSPQAFAVPAVLLLSFRDSWGLCKERIRSEIGEDSFEAWFNSIRLVDIKGPVVRLSVISVFLKRRIIRYYSNALVAACKAEWPQIRQVQLGVRTCIVRNMQKVPMLALPAPVVEYWPDTQLRPNATGALRYAGLLPRDLFPGHPGADGVSPPLRIEDVQRTVARQYGVSRAQLISSRRTANLIRPRQVAMYLAKILTGRSLPDIGMRFGGKDHTTVLHAVRKIAWLVGDKSIDPPLDQAWREAHGFDQALADLVESLKRQLQR